MQAISEIKVSAGAILRYNWTGVLALFLLTTSMTFLLFSPGLFLTDLPGEAVNVFSITGSLFAVYLNIALWAKMHNQRLGRYGRAKAWVSSTYKMAGILFVVTLIA